MRTEDWLAAVDLELTALGVGLARRADALAEIEVHLADAGTDPLVLLDQVGSPAAYARELAASMDVGEAPGVREREPGPVRVTVADLGRRRRRRTLFEGWTWQAHAGEIVAVVGPNGSGKSTMLRLVAGLERPDAGSVEVEGPIGYAPQQGGLDPWLNPIEHLDLAGAARGLEPSEARREGLALARELGWEAAGDPVAGRLSGGTRQKLNVVLALLGGPPVVVLDEPYQGMDAASTRRFWDLLWSWGDGGGCAVVSSHDDEIRTRAHTVIDLGRPSAASASASGQPGRAPGTATGQVPGRAPGTATGLEGRP